MQDFIEQNREEIDRVILSVCPNVGEIDDDERELWVLNDEYLYTLALEAGVDG